jgi:inner membrane protein
MDSVTQILLGASVAAAVVPAAHRRRALGIGAVLGTLPDLDVLPLALVSDPVAVMTLHRGLSHSLLVLPVLGALLWWMLRRRWTPVRTAPVAWFLAIELALVTHPLLDAFTVYGTQLLWPFSPPPVMWSSVFIIDPGYTLWLLLGTVAALVLGPKPAAARWLLAGLLLSSGYLGWSLVAKWMVERDADAALAQLGLQDAPRFSVPMPFNTLLWRVVAMTPDGFVEGERSLVADRGPMQFRRYASDIDALAAVADIPAVQTLRWFNRGFMKADVRDERLVLSDLRMGAEPDYTFRFVVAKRVGHTWRAIPPEQATWPWEAGRRLQQMWQRIWVEPPVETQAASGNPGATPAASAEK